MECHIEQVLYRDQRTIKARYFEDLREHQHHNTCPTRRGHLQPSETTRQTRFHPKGHHQTNQSQDVALSIQSMSNTSSLYLNNCHNQYFSKFERLLYQTEVQCRCEGVRYPSEMSERKMAQCKSWFKQFHSALLLSTYLFLIVFPYASAVPTTISSRHIRSVSNPKESSQSEMNTTNLIPAYRSARSAADRATDLKDKFRMKSASDPEVMYHGVPAYDWLPQVPNPSDVEDHLNSLNKEQILLDLYRHISIMKVPVEQLETDYKGDTVWSMNISAMRGSLDNILEDLSVTISDNNLPIDSHVSKSIMPENFRNLNKTDQALRDWLIIRTLVDVLKYTIAVFKHLDIPYN